MDYLNISSRIFLTDQNIDVLAINENRLDDKVSDQEVTLQGYNIIRRDKPLKGRSGGGIYFYISSDINYSVRKDLDNQLLEILSIQIRKPNSKPFVITLWYRSPKKKFTLRTIHAP